MNPIPIPIRPAARTLAALAGAVALAVPVAACGGGPGTVSTGAGQPPAAASTTTTLVLKSSTKANKPSPTGAQQHALMLTFARCVRARGISNFPNPSRGGQPFTVTAPQLGVSASRLLAAERACKTQLRGRAGASGPAATGARARAKAARAEQTQPSTSDNSRKFARCMRARGASLTGTQSAKDQAAARACKQALAP
ncbi:MAG TPA: hypothetical protein VKV06_02205 [Acidimicrobiales bacterium]|nr:hypothetical protein [Acidimicrobiales bacterium]